MKNNNNNSNNTITGSSELSAITLVDKNDNVKTEIVKSDNISSSYHRLPIQVIALLPH